MRGTFLVALMVMGLPATAERNLLPTQKNRLDVCANQPAEPAWMQEIGLRQAYKRALVQDIYRAQNLERIVSTGSCSCDTRFPSWEAAETKFKEGFASAERWEMLKASDASNRRANEFRPQAKAICEAEGNW